MQNVRIWFFTAILCIALLALCACGSSAAPEETIAPVTGAPTLPIDFPASYKDAPEAYWPVLDDLLKWIFVVANRWEYKPWDDWGINPGIHMITEDALNGAGEYVGYAIKDINDDGTPELVILFSPSEDEVHPLALFTLQDNAPVHLYTYKHREIGGITEDGTIYVAYAVSMGGNMRSYKLEPSAAELTKLTDYDYTGQWYDDDHLFYQIEGDERIYTEEEIEALQEEYHSPPNPMKLTFIPIEQ